MAIRNQQKLRLGVGGGGCQERANQRISVTRSTSQENEVATETVPTDNELSLHNETSLMGNGTKM